LLELECQYRAPGDQISEPINISAHPRESLIRTS
jgi:hypothetical protein